MRKMFLEAACIVMVPVHCKVYIEVDANEGVTPMQVAKSLLQRGKDVTNRFTVQDTEVSDLCPANCQRPSSGRWEPLDEVLGELFTANLEVGKFQNQANRVVINNVEVIDSK